MSQENTTVAVVINLPKPHQPIVAQLGKGTRVSNIIELLAVSPVTRYWTSYELSLKGEKLIEDQPIHELGENLSIDVTRVPYTAKSLFNHVISTRDLIGFTANDTQFGISTGTKFAELGLDSEEDKAVYQAAASGLFEKGDFAKLMKTQASVITPAVRQLVLSPYNPVPAQFSTRGHLLYLQLATLEGETFHITATARGFFINKSSSTKFDPTPKQEETFSTLYELIASVSKKFVSHLDNIKAKLAALDPVSYLHPTNSSLAKPWLVSIPPFQADFGREQFTKKGSRNFLEEYQTVRELGSENLGSRLERERLLAKLSYEFTQAATAGAMDVLFGKLSALNPDDERAQQIFLNENIFYSFGIDANGNFADRGGDPAARCVANQDLNTIKLLNRYDLSSFSHLLTIIVDFAGQRVVCQTPVPGLFSTVAPERITNEDGSVELVEAANDVSVVHGLDEASNKVLFDESFDAALKDFQKLFHLSTHEVDGVQLGISKESKGIVGSDKRKYLLDLSSTAPLDYHFWQDNVVNSDKPYAHKQTLIRHEAISKWWTSKVEATDKSVADSVEANAFSFNPDAYFVEGVEDPTVVEISAYLRDQIIPQFVEDMLESKTLVPFDGSHLTEVLHINGINARHLGSVIAYTKKSIAAKREAYEQGLEKIKEGNAAALEKEGEQLKKLEQMLKDRQEEINKYIAEGKEVPEELKQNIQLGEEEIIKPTKNDPLSLANDIADSLIYVSELEIITRCMKHFMRGHAKTLPIEAVPSLFAHVNNLLFGSDYSEPVPEFIGEPAEYPFTKLTKQEIAENIVAQAATRYRYELPVYWTNIYQPMVLIRELSIKFGAQWVNREYFFSKEAFESWKMSQDKKLRNKIVAPLNTFSPEDVTIIPIIKSAPFKSNLAEEIWELAASKSENKEESLTLFAESLAFREEVNGAVDKSVAEAYLTLSTVYYNQELAEEAIKYARKAVQIYERCSGADSHLTVRSLINLAFLENVAKHGQNSIVTYQRALKTLSAISPSVHPSTFNALTVCYQILSDNEQERQSLNVLLKTADLIAQVQGENVSALGFVRSRLANSYVKLDDLNNSLKQAKLAFGVFKDTVGYNDELTLQARKWVSQMTTVLENAEQVKKLNAQQAQTAQAEAKKEHSGKQEKPNPALANKSIDELMQFIEGGSSAKTNKKKKSKAKK